MAPHRLRVLVIIIIIIISSSSSINIIIISRGETCLVISNNA